MKGWQVNVFLQLYLNKINLKVKNYIDLISQRRNIQMQLTQAQKTLLGITILKFATGFTSDWGVISLYVLSYYHFRGAPLEIKASTNSLIMIILVIPCTLCLIISTKIAHLVGYARLIRWCAIAYLVLPLFSFFNFSFELFIFCNLIAPCSAFSLSLVPIFHCLYSHYAEHKSLATGAAICSFGLGAIVWNLIATFAINPENVVPDIETGDPNLNFFPEDIANRMPRALNYIFLTSGIMFFLASQLITSNADYKDEHDDSIDLNVQPMLTESNANHFSRVSQGENSHENPDPKTIISPRAGQKQQLQPTDSKKPVDIKQYIKEPIAIMLFIMNITGCLFQIYIQLNTKLVYMPILQDDHLISVGLMLIILSSAIFSIGWGFLADKKGPPFTIVTFTIIDLAAKIFACLSRSKLNFILSMIFIGGTDKTMLILFAPILINTFGLRVATELLPFKGISGILSIILAAALGLVFANFSPQTALYAICMLSFLNIGLGLYLAYIVKQKESKKQQTKQISN